MLFSTDEDKFIQEMRQFIPASVASDKDRLWPFVEAAERKFILPILGRAAYDDLQKFYNNRPGWTSGSGEDAAKTAELLRLLKLAEINLAYFTGFDVLNVKISDLGFQRSESESFKGLYKYQEENLRTYFKETGFNGIDDALLYLEENIEYFPEWEDSEAYTERKSAFLKDTKSLNEICDIGNSRLIWLRLQPFIQQCIDFDIKPLLGNTVYDKLIAELAKATPDEKYTKLAGEIRKPLAFLSVALLVQNTGTLTEKGLYFDRREPGFPDNTATTPAQGSANAQSFAYYRSTGDKYLEALRAYLKNEAFPDYVVPTGNVFQRDNDHKKTFWT